MVCMDNKALKDCRAKLALTQQAIAAELGISRRFYIYMEQGERPIPRYIALACKALEHDTRPDT